MKRYRYRKIKPEDMMAMKKLRGDDLFYREIAEIFNVTKNTIIYHLSPREKEFRIKSANKSTNKMTKKQKEEKIRKAAPRMKKYIIERYQNDEEFRRRFLDNVLRSQKRIRNQRKKQGLCPECGKKRQNKDFIFCEKCREVCRKKYQELIKYKEKYLRKNE